MSGSPEEREPRSAMRFRNDVPMVLLVFTLCCGGKSLSVSDGGSAGVSSGGGASSGVNASSGGSGGTSFPDDAGEDALGELSDAETDGSDSDMADIPDAFPTSCGQHAFELEPDAAAHTCAFTPA